MSGSLGALEAVGGPASAHATTAVAAGQPQSASHAEAAAFAREVQAPAETVQVGPASAGHHVSADLSSRFHALSDRISSLDQAAPSMQPGADAATLSPAALMQELGRYSSLVFVATVSSNGASEGSKMFNTLLKGQ